MTGYGRVITVTEMPSRALADCRLRAVLGAAGAAVAC